MIGPTRLKAPGSIRNEVRIGPCWVGPAHQAGAKDGIFDYIL